MKKHWEDYDVKLIEGMASLIEIHKQIKDVSSQIDDNNLQKKDKENLQKRLLLLEFYLRYLELKKEDQKQFLSVLVNCFETTTELVLQKLGKFKSQIEDTFNNLVEHEMSEVHSVQKKYSEKRKRRLNEYERIVKLWR